MAIVLNGLIGYWHFSKGNDGATWDNIAPNATGNHGTISGAILELDGMRFDGINDLVSIPSFNPPTNRTIEIGLIPDSPIVTGTLFAKTATERFHISSATQFAYITGNRTGSATHLMTANQFNQLVAGVNNDRTSLWANGSSRLSGNSARTPTTGSATWNIGGLSGSTFFKGKIVFIRVYNRMLSNAEVAQNWNEREKVALVDIFDHDIYGNSNGVSNISVKPKINKTINFYGRVSGTSNSKAPFSTNFKAYGNLINNSITKAKTEFLPKFYLKSKFTTSNDVFSNEGIIVNKSSTFSVFNSYWNRTPFSEMGWGQFEIGWHSNAKGRISLHGTSGMSLGDGVFYEKSETIYDNLAITKISYKNGWSTKGVYILEVEVADPKDIFKNLMFFFGGRYSFSHADSSGLVSKNTKVGEKDVTLWTKWHNKELSDGIPSDTNQVNFVFLPRHVTNSVETPQFSDLSSSTFENINGGFVGGFILYVIMSNGVTSDKILDWVEQDLIIISTSPYDYSSFVNIDNNATSSAEVSFYTKTNHELFGNIVNAESIAFAKPFINHTHSISGQAKGSSTSIAVEVNTIPSTPVNLSANLTGNEVSLFWSPSTEVHSYIVRLNGEFIAETKDTNYIDTPPLDVGSIYIYSISAKNILGESQSSQASITISSGDNFMEDFEDTTYLLPISGSWSISTLDKYSGTSSLKSGSIFHNQKSDSIITLNNRVGAKLSFNYRVSSEANWDKFYAYINGVVIPSINGISGSGVWLSYETILSSANSILSLTYSKDTSNSSFLDGAFIDNLALLDKHPILLRSYANTSSSASAKPIVETSTTTVPLVTSVTLSKDKISDENGVNATNLTFRFNSDVSEWCVRVMGVSPDTGILADSGGAVSARTQITAIVDWTELYQEGENRVNIYGKNSVGWTPYDLDY